MRYDTAPEFDGDFKRLATREQQLFMKAVHRMIEACKREPDRVPDWPSELRVGRLTDHPGIYEMTWSFAAPDGRATFEIVSDEDAQPVIRWRRIGDHKIYKKP